MTDQIQDKLNDINKNIKEIENHFKNIVTNCANADILKNSVTCLAIAENTKQITESLIVFEVISKIEADEYKNIKDLNELDRAKYFINLSQQELNN